MCVCVCVCVCVRVRVDLLSCERGVDAVVSARKLLLRRWYCICADHLASSAVFVQRNWPVYPLLLRYMFVTVCCICAARAGGSVLVQATWPALLYLCSLTGSHHCCICAAVVASQCAVFVQQRADAVQCDWPGAQVVLYWCRPPGQYCC